MAFTLGFPSPAYLSDKFLKHVVERAEFNVATEEEYAALADAFLGGPRAATTWECYRGNGERVRYNALTEELGILSPGNVIVTYFKPDPAIHGRPNNLAYFRSACQQ